MRGGKTQCEDQSIIKPLEGSWEAPVRQPMVKGLHQMGLYFRDSGVCMILFETGSRVFQDGLTLVVQLKITDFLILPPPSESWDHRHVSPLLAYVVL